MKKNGIFGIKNAVIMRFLNCKIAKRCQSQEKPELTSWGSIWKFSEEARIPDTMPFGKHKGMPIKDVPRDYKEWLKGQPDIDEYLLKALKP